MRQGMMKDKKQIESELKNLAQIVSKELHQEWLLALEIIELQQQKLGFEPSEHDWSRKLIENTLDTKNQYATEIQELIEKGLRLSSVDDEHIH
jgi:hypothetical protein